MAHALLTPVPTRTPADPPPNQDARLSALERLYHRRAAVDALIQSLEDYQKFRVLRKAPCIEINAVRKCS